ncbi:MAG TPA: hydantoinase B/oxoprolinase family protein [Fimbriimonadales bacterium]|nr:hydantoinase B/oxoprolinase family protein [Fimbriimonadales bacterium]
MQNRSFDPIRVALYTEILSSIAEEMGVALERTSSSPNIKERRDYSCALFDKSGRMIAQAAHIPVHLGAMETLMKKWLIDGPPLEEGKMYITNDPFFAGTHLPDISVIAPVFLDGKTIGFVASRAHHADIGGAAPGSFAPVQNVHEEGFLIAPSELNEEIIERVLERTRNPDERLGDLQAQRASIHVGIHRFKEIAKRYGERLDEYVEECLEYAHSLTRRTLAQIPNGVYEAEDVLEDVPKPGQFVKIALRVITEGDKIIFDFTGTGPQQDIGINATEAVTKSACYYVVRCLVPDAPTNGGCWGGITVITEPRTLVNAQYPAPVVAGNTETSQRIVDVCLQALSKALPDVIPACSQGTMNNLALGTEKWTYYETIAGGAGGGPRRRGASAIHTHMTNTRNTPIEALEVEFPLQAMRYAIRSSSGGKGKMPGGDGVVREIRVLEEGVILSLMTDRRVVSPPGFAGGEGGKPGRNVLIRQGKEESLPSKGAWILNAGDTIRIETPGGGGFGSKS